MIPRHQAVILIVLLLASLIMGGVLFRMREKAHDQMLAGQDSAPTQAPQVAAPEQATLMVASDDDNSLRSQVHSLPLPADPGAKARAVLGKLLDLYAASDSTHPVPGGATSVAQVFLLPAAKTGSAASVKDSGPQMAVVNLKGSFAASHPSGLETESLTVLSICGTLHANLPQVREVRFLVDGQVRPSLAGHADLTRTYLVSDSDAAPTSDSVPAVAGPR
ncbi:GerMN domain-containing protein [Occallatibacter riparius]|uniref:GerMN domain-containing protein n=1 Tax=Occallatibacter riparius TaxID=1002689 RepID=A0A9J7BXQ8_9BACT|nr:GerMN domain-containing protein [Occallatibacter riparius]UWZ86754.1 GerMN domain-containing protein [Occallatibacter riparius]